MNVIDIGAGFGVYTFSAASRVGADGIVLAIEPFSESVDCLNQTCLINQIENVRIFETAVGDRACTAQLVLQPSSEFNYLAMDDQSIAVDTQTTTVSCTTLDTLIKQTNLEHIDIIKISTEGSELAILIGCEEIITKFAPTIIYNSYTSKGVDLAAAEYLIDRGYELFRYQPYLQQLVPLVDESDFAEVIKAIAIPKVERRD